MRIGGPFRNYLKWYSTRTLVGWSDKPYGSVVTREKETRDNFGGILCSLGLNLISNVPTDIFLFCFSFDSFYFVLFCIFTSGTTVLTRRSNWSDVDSEGSLTWTCEENNKFGQTQLKRKWTLGFPEWNIWSRGGFETVLRDYVRKSIYYSILKGFIQDFSWLRFSLIINTRTSPCRVICLNLSVWT